MFLDIGWPELVLIGVVALVFIGPKDLPRALRVAGHWFGKARALSHELHNSVNQMIREAELDDMREQLKKATEIDINKELQRTVDPTSELAQSIKQPEIHEPGSTQIQPAANESVASLPAKSQMAVRGEPEQHPLPFQATEPGVTPSTREEQPVPRNSEPSKP